LHSSAVYGKVGRSEVSASDEAHQSQASKTEIYPLTSPGVKKDDLKFVQGRHGIRRRRRWEHFDVGPVILLQGVFLPGNFSTRPRRVSQKGTYEGDSWSRNLAVQLPACPRSVTRKWCGGRGQRTSSCSRPNLAPPRERDPRTRKCEHSPWQHEPGSTRASPRSVQQPSGQPHQPL
jgi:hypothetical protein